MLQYKEFASIYDKLMWDIDYQQWYKYITRILKKYDIKEKRLLEMACGTGSMTKFFSEDMYDITCFDISEEMLVVAYEKLRKCKNVQILNQDMRNFSLNKKFDIVLSLCDSINYITEKEDLMNVFNNVYKHLDEDGIFIFDINSYFKISNIIGNNTFINDEEDVFYTWQSFFDKEDSLGYYDLTFFIYNGSLYERIDEEHIQRAYTTEEIMELLDKSGFKKIDVYQGFSFEDIREKTERINFVVRK